ncbi:unnamed protein product [Schistosoma margrebowiei]|uniref:DUF6451 domain-containing protein n=1 Tax=Schistosoma margrebowiei TaxID=48269 RepID=A0A183N051_9TREM|nr:unnamed protein product [Schistosoma margrebowiei]
MQFNDLDFADNPTLQLHTQQEMQENTISVAAGSAAVGLNIHKGKSKIRLSNTACNYRVTFDRDAMDGVKPLTYLGTIIGEHGESDADVGICKARATYLQMKNILNSRQLSTNTKIRIFHRNI